MRLWFRLKGLEERGNAAVEFALVFPFLLALVLGVVEFGRVLFIQQVITIAVRESSRASATGYEPYTTAADRVLGPAGIPSPTSSCGTSPTLGKSTICQAVVDVPVGGAKTQAHRVIISYNIPYLTPLGGTLNLLAGGDGKGWGSGVTLSSVGVMRE
jgi:Flp pilus assembly protein TadG